MADAVTSQTLIDGPKHAVMKFTNVSDGSGESAVKKSRRFCSCQQFRWCCV